MVFLVAHARPAITQAELLLIFGYVNQIRTLKRMKTELEESIIDRLTAGVEVEPGPHRAELLEVGHSLRLKIR